MDRTWDRACGPRPSTARVQVRELSWQGPHNPCPQAKAPGSHGDGDRLLEKYLSPARLVSARGWDLRGRQPGTAVQPALSPALLPVCLMDALSPTVSREGPSQAATLQAFAAHPCVRALRAPRHAADVQVPPRAHTGGAKHRGHEAASCSGHTRHLRGSRPRPRPRPRLSPRSRAGLTVAPGPRLRPAGSAHVTWGHGGQMLAKALPGCPTFHGVRGTRGGAPWRHLSHVPTRAAGCGGPRPPSRPTQRRVRAVWSLVGGPEGTVSLEQVGHRGRCGRCALLRPVLGEFC